MFSVGQTVLYSSNGVCEITEITKKKIGGKNIEYYVLKPLCSQSSTLFIPTHNEQLVSKMRCTLSAYEINNILASISESDDKWIDDKTERLNEYRQIISTGDCCALVTLIRQLHTHSKLQESKGRHLHISDERILKEAEKMVCDEISLVLNIDRSEVIPLVLK